MHQTSENNPRPKTAKDSIAEDQKRLKERVHNNKECEEDLNQQAIEQTNLSKELASQRTVIERLMF